MLTKRQLIEGLSGVGDDTPIRLQTTSEPADLSFSTSRDRGGRPFILLTSTSDPTEVQSGPVQNRAHEVELMGSSTKKELTGGGFATRGGGAVGETLPEDQRSGTEENLASSPEERAAQQSASIRQGSAQAGVSGATSDATSGVDAKAIKEETSSKSSSSSSSSKK